MLRYTYLLILPAIFLLAAKTAFAKPYNQCNWPYTTNCHGNYCPSCHPWYPPRPWPYTSEEKVAVSVYYESLCPDSRDIFTHELCPNWSKISDYVHLKLVPFGKASSVSSGFDCQHGPKECYGNMFQSCAFSMLQPGTKQLNFACCFMANPYDYSSCLRRAGLAASEVRRCMTSGEGRELQLIAEVDTKHNTNGPSYVPTVVFNKKFNETDMRKIRESQFMSVLCRYEKRVC